MRLPNRVWSCLALLALAAIAPLTHAELLTCPATLLERPELQREEKPWQLISHAAERPLEQVGILLGPADEAGALVPSSSRKSRAVEKVVWEIVRSAGDQLWIGCSYTGTTAKALLALPATASRCTVSYALLPSGKRSRIEAVACQ